MGDANVKGRFLLCGKLRTTSPLLIGTGEKGYIDIVVQKDERNSPYIPATSMGGVLRHYFFNKIKLDNVDKKQLEYFWGSEKSEVDTTYQSSFLLWDLPVLNSPKIVIRDGIRIDNKSGVVEDEGKFTYEVVEPGAEFNFNAEIVLRKGFAKEIFLKIITTIIKALVNGEVYLGAMTTKGLGRCSLVDYELYEYDFQKKEDVIAWLKGNNQKEQLRKIDFKDAFSLKTKENELVLKAVFNLQSSLIVKSYSGLPQESDAVHICSAGKDIIPGSSIKGAIRARAIKIINTLGGPREEMVKSLWGSQPNSTEDLKQKSRIIVEEAVIKKAIRETQFRVKIDRFTGGVIDGGLFDSLPVWRGNNTEVTINIKVDDYKDWEAGLMLLLLKDLWSGDLPLGGEKTIGRGVLQGKTANIRLGNKQYLIRQETRQEKTRLQLDGEQQELEKLVQAFTQKCKRKGEKICVD